MDFIFRAAEAFLKKHKRLQRYRRVFAFLAAVVVFATTYELILPAITMDRRRAAETPGVEVGVAAEGFEDVQEAVEADQDTASEGSSTLENEQAEGNGAEQAETLQDAGHTETASSQDVKEDSVFVENAAPKDAEDDADSEIDTDANSASAEESTSDESASTESSTDGNNADSDISPASTEETPK